MGATHQTLWLALVVFTAWFGLSACSRLAEPRVEPFEGKTMGTTYTVKVVVPVGQTLDEGLGNDIAAVLENVNSKMSTYRADSEVTLFNRADLLEPFAVSQETATVVSEAVRLGQLSGGALDITIGPLVDLWGFGPTKREGKPTAEEIAQIKDKTGLRHLHVNGLSLQKDIPGLAIDLSSVAKGYAVDRVAALLEANKLDNYLVEVGGEMRLSGNKPDGSDWRIAVEKPLAGARIVELIIAPQNNAMATSGDYRNYFEQDGVRYSHTLDATTGQPITHTLASVTVIHASAMTADGLATAINVMGPDKGFALAQAEGLAVYLIIKTDDGFTARYTEQFKPYMVN